ncbi:MAG: hypothetical protein GY929_17505 [Actinomycetia bacterium]|nr:hypothetical protein [Actinomycetes bacterium]
MPGASTSCQLAVEIAGQLMQALYVADRQVDALRAFQAYREVLADAGLEPGAESVALE